jgi:alpha-L-rhamnosidase
MKQLEWVGWFTLVLFLNAGVWAAPVHLRCEYRINPLGMDKAAPQLSWQSDSSTPNWKQAGYQILVASSESGLANKADVWDSGRVDSGISVGIRYGGPKLLARKRYFWKVRVWDAKGEASESEEAAWWEMGLLDRADWRAEWIHRPSPEFEADRAAMRWIWLPGQDPLAVVPKAEAVFRTTISLAGKPKDAVLFLIARGSYHAAVNGHPVVSKSDWSSFDRKDISGWLQAGKNVVEVSITAPSVPSYGPGTDAKAVKTAWAGLVKITQTDGKQARVVTGSNWEARTDDKAAWQPAAVFGDLDDKRLGARPGPLPQPAAYLRKSFTVAKKVKSARLFVTALGSYRIHLNGMRVGQDVLTPEFTDYRKRVLYQTYDVTDLLKSGPNALGAVLGDGWYNSGLTWVGMHFFPPPDRLLAQLQIEFADGTNQTVGTDGSWKTAASPILHSEIYAGETYDAQRELAGWDQADFRDAGWDAAVVAAAPPATVQLTSQNTEPVKVIAKMEPKKVVEIGSGTYVFDMGQNMVGWATLRVSGAAGTRVKMRFAEILNPDGSIYTPNLRNADATDLYILRGEGQESFTPHFTFHGFRYVEVTGYPGKPGLDALTGEVVSSVNGQPSGQLTTASALVNQMWSIGTWGQRGNYLSIATDCPQRDERLGWMGDAGVFWRTGAYNYDVAAFSQKFIQDIVDAQTSQGAFTNVSPNTLPFGGESTEGAAAWSEGNVGAPGWGDAGVIVPWTTWVQYGNTSIIDENWDAMKHWLSFIQERNPDFLRKRGVGPNFADWLAPDENTNKDLLATAYWALIANMMADMARATGKAADARHYDEVVQSIREAFQKAYIKDTGEVGTGTQTSYVVALYTKMAPPALEPLLVDRLVKDIEGRGWHLSTGFLGTPFLLFTLSDHGRTDVAYRLLLNDTYPSWGYMLSKGATTWWERWNGDTGDPSMNSYNHYAFGSVMAWVYRYAAGIDTTPDAPGFKRIVIHPHLDPRIPSLHGEYDSAYGKIVSDWKAEAGQPFQLSVTIPANTSAKVVLPAAEGQTVTLDSKTAETHLEGGLQVVDVGSGSYRFEVK